MLPVAFQVPAAILLLLGGLLACFMGYCVFRLVLAIYGFILGALIASSLMGAGEPGSLVLAAIAGGVVGALVLVAAYFIGVALVGSGLAILLLNLVWSQLGAEPHPLLVVGVAIVGAFIALALQRYVIIVGTAFGGAWTALVGGLALVGDVRSAEAASRGDVWLAFPMYPSPGNRWVIVAWLVLGTIGALVQFGLTAGPVARRRGK